MTGEIIVPVAACTNLIAIELLRGQVPFTLYCVEVSTVPYLVIVLSFVGFVIS